MDDRVANFLSNWIDANILNASHNPDEDAEVMSSRYLTDAVAAGITLDDVNDGWDTAEVEIKRALKIRANRGAH